MWTERQRLAFPASMLDAANALAHIIDPDTGGAYTFSADRTRGGYVYAEIPFLEHFYPLVERRNPDEWSAMIPQIASDFGREPIPEETIRALCVNLLINDEIPSE